MSTKRCPVCGQKLKPTYKIVRMYRDKDVRQTIVHGLSLAEARKWCRNPETSSSTCTKPENKRRTDLMGDWFDSYEFDGDEHKYDL